MTFLLIMALIVQVVGISGCASTPGRSNTVYTNDRDALGYYSQPAYTQSSASPSAQDQYNKKLIKEGLLGAATGAIAAEASGGKAGTGALIGAGTNIIGGALFDVLTAPQPKPQQAQYAPYVNQWYQQNPDTHRIIRKFDSNGNVISEEVFTR